MTTNLTTTDDAGLVPAPTSARVELPTQAAVDAASIDLDLLEARLVLVLISALICRGRSKSRDKVTQAINGLVACCRIEGVRDGLLVEAAHPDLALYGWRSGATAMRMLGIDHRVLEQYWQKARRQATDVSLPLDWALTFVRAELWPALLTLIEWGPAETGERLEDAVFAMARQPLVVETRRREAGATLSAGTINTRVTGILQLCDELVKLRTRAGASLNHGLPLELLESWVSKPPRPVLGDCGAVWARVDTSGPSFEQVRELLQRLDDEVRRARPRLRYFALRRRVIGGLLCAHGQRVQAIHALNVDDYRPAHNFGDGTVGPALIYRPGKTRAFDEQHVLGVPPELASWIEEWIEYTGRSIGEVGSPMWPHRKPKPGQKILRLNASAFARIVSGHHANDGTGSTPLLRRGEDRYHGYNPHAYRHSCYSAMRRAGAQAKLAHATDYLEQTADDFARAVVGHDLIRGTGDIYRDIAHQQQHLARVAIEYAWEELRRRPSVVGPDPAAIDEASSRLEFLTVALAERSEELHAIGERQRSLNQMRSKLAGDALAEAAIESHALVFKLARLQSEIATLNSRIVVAREDVRRALEQPIELDCDDREGCERRLRAARERGKKALAVVADEGRLSVREVAAILDTTPQTVNKWIRNGFPATREPLWRPGAWSKDARGANTLALRDLDPTPLTPIQQERLLVAQLRGQRTMTNAAA